MPITLRDQVIGVLDLRSEGETFSSETVSLVKEVAGRLALAMENARLLEDTRRRAAREQLVGEVTARMRETLDVETVLKTAAREIGEALELAALDVQLGVAETPPSSEPQHNQGATGR